MGKYYAVSQFNHGHEYRWIFEEFVLKRNIYKDREVPEEDYNDYGFPIGGSNSSSTFIRRMNSDDEIRNFLTSPGDGPNLYDPTLVDIGEYLLTVDNNYGSCTDMFVNKFGLNYKDLEQTDDALCRKKKVEEMCKKLAGHDKIDADNPFYGKSRDMYFLDLCYLYESEVLVNSVA